MFKLNELEIMLLRELYATPTRYYHTFGHASHGHGVDIFPGFAAAEVLYNDNGSVKGVATPCPWLA